MTAENGTRYAIGLTCSVGMVTLFHLWILSGLDLRDLPGPAGTLLVLDLVSSTDRFGPPVWLGRVLMAFGLDPLQAARCLSSGSLLCAAAGAGLGARALSGDRAGWVAALFVGVWSLTASEAWLLGPGGPAWGLSWLGTGCVWLGCRTTRSIWILTGAALVGLGIATKPTVLPMLGLLLLAPWLAPRQWRVRAAWILGAGSLVGFSLISQADWTHPLWAVHRLGVPLRPTFHEVPGWLGTVATLPQRGTPQGHLIPVGLLALLGTLAPAQRRPFRLILWTATVGAAACVGELGGARLMPRHMLPLSFGLVLLIASVAEIDRRRLFVWSGVTLLLGVGALDTLALAKAFSAQREAFLDVAPTPLPAPPALFTQTYTPLAPAVFRESSISGAVELMAMASSAPLGVTGISLRDRRDTHLQVAAAIADHPYRLLTPALCCESDEAIPACAVRVVAQIRESQTHLILPAKASFVPPEDQIWWNALTDSVPKKRGQRRWYVLKGRGEATDLPCRPPRK